MIYTSYPTVSNHTCSSELFLLTFIWLLILPLPKHYAICINSLPRISSLRKPYDVVILDESEQVLQHLVGGTITKEERKRIVNLFYKHIQNAKAVYCLDADLGELTAEAIRELRGPDDDYCAILNEYKTGGDIKLYQNRTNIVSAIHNAIRTTFPVFVTSNSKKFIDELTRQLEHDDTELLDIELHDATKYFKITSENSESREVEWFIDDIDRKFGNYRVILATPALGTGVDIQARCSHVFGVFEAKVNTHYDFDQQLWRVRNPDAVSVFVAPQTFRHPTDPQHIKEFMIESHEKANEQLGYVDDGEEKPEWYSRVLNLYCHVQALQNTSKNHLRDNFVALKQSHGYQIEWIEKYEEEIEDEDYSEIWEMEKEERTQLLLNAYSCDYSYYEILKRRRDKTKEVKALCLRYEIENVFKENLNDNPLLIEYQEKEINWDLLNYEKFMTPVEDLIERDLKQREEEFHLIDLDNYTQRVELIARGLAVAGFCKRDRRWNLLDEFSKEDMDDFIEWARDNASELQSVLDIAVGRVDSEPIRTVKSLLKETGMIAAISNREKVDGMTVTYYQLSEDRYALLEKYRLRRKEWWENTVREREEEMRLIESLTLGEQVSSNHPEPVGELTP